MATNPEKGKETGMVDVIIPVYRPDDKLEKLIDKLNRQTVKPDHVFFMLTMTHTAVDERTRRILIQAENNEITWIKKEEFDHGGTRNLGAAKSEAEYILFMTQDAVPVDDELIAHLVKALQSDKTAIAYARQLPNKEAGIIERYTRKFNYPEESCIKSADDMERMGIKTFFCSNVCAAYKREIYEKMGGFVQHTIFNEDMIMASKIVRAGYEIAYVADAKVIHSHKYTYRQQFSRNFDLAVSQKQYAEMFDGVRSESEGIRLVRDTARFLISQGRWQLLPDLVLQSGFKFLGYRFGKQYDKLPMRLVKRFSMNPAFWEDKQ